jgi:hypothetical protein
MKTRKLVVLTVVLAFLLVATFHAQEPLTHLERFANALALLEPVEGSLTGSELTTFRHAQTRLKNLLTAVVAADPDPDPGPDPRPEPLPLPAPTCSTQRSSHTDHAYFELLAARSDCFAAYSLRDALQVDSFVKNTSKDFDYLYPDDPDPRQQDAMRIRIRRGQVGPMGILNLPIGPTAGKSLLFTHDYWLGAEWRSDLTHINGHKNGAPFGFEVEGMAGTWVTNQTNYRNALRAPHNQPPGGPFVAFPFPQVNADGRRIKAPFWRDGAAGRRRADLPYGAPPKEQRGYTEAIQPFDTETYPAGQEFGLVAERWHRLWHYFERAPEEDWSDPTIKNGPDMHAYRWSFWFADAERGVVRMLNGAVIGIPAASKGFARARMIYGKGGVEADALTLARPDLIGYARNVVILHGTRKADVLALLRAPSGSARTGRK